MDSSLYAGLVLVRHTRRKQRRKLSFNFLCIIRMVVMGIQRGDNFKTLQTELGKMGINEKSRKRNRKTWFEGRRWNLTSDVLSFASQRHIR